MTASGQRDLHGQSVLVLGASRGIGKAIALAIADAGANVTIAARRDGDREFAGSLGEAIDRIRSTGGRGEARFCDIADSASVDELVAEAASRTGRLDAVINSAVFISYAPLLDISDQEWRRGFEVNVTGAFFLTRAAARIMKSQGGGHIIHLTGAGARDVGVVNEITGASKAALERFVRGAAYELKPFNIAVNLFDPGGVRTERAEIIRGPQQDWTGFAAPADVAKAAVHLAAQGAKEMTGEIYSFRDFAQGH